MFENLLAQDEVLALLKADVESGRLPPTLLFSGPPGAGKLTAALELGRTLSCVRGAAWNCPCPSCSRHRVLAHTDILLFGSRTFPEEIPAALELLTRAPNKASSFFFVRAVRKLARRFDAALYEGEESRLVKAMPLVREIEEALEALAPDKIASGGLGPAATKAAAQAARLEALVPDAPPVFMVRNAELWARLAPFGPRKTVVIENADRMLESARNALLKVLEEPPESVRFVLLSSRRSAIMGTILSRSRTYTFKRRDAGASALVLERVFRSQEPAPSVESFLAARRAFPPNEARLRAETCLGAALASRSDAARLTPALAALATAATMEGHTCAAALAGLLEATKDFGQKDDRYASSFRFFLAALAARLGELLREPGLGAEGTAQIERFASLVREARVGYESWNRSPSLLAETLLYAMGEDG